MQSEKVGELTFYAVLDNHEPPRTDTSGVAEIWRAPDGRETIRIADACDHFPDAFRSSYLFDDGASVVPYYVTGWNANNEGAVFLQAMPTNPDGKTRADNDRVIDFGHWCLGPRRAYHLKITRS